MLSNYIKHGTLSSAELSVILNILPAVRKRIGGARTYGDQSKRKGSVAWIQIEQYPSVFNITQSHVIEQYADTPLGITDIAEIQYARYIQGDYFYWHRDNIPTHRSDSKTRGITMTINLTDPKEYTGGELLLSYKDNVIELNKDQGSYIIFPAFLRHQACEVLSGIREALVVWTYLTVEEIQWLTKLDK